MNETDGHEVTVVGDLVTQHQNAISSSAGDSAPLTSSPFAVTSPSHHHAETPGFGACRYLERRSWIHRCTCRLPVPTFYLDHLLTGQFLEKQFLSSML